MAQLWWRLLGPRAIVSDGVMGVNLASGSNPLAKCFGAQLRSKLLHAALAGFGSLSACVGDHTSATQQPPAAPPPSASLKPSSQRAPKKKGPHAVAAGPAPSPQT